jgi:phospholipid/cholesterol/gamma-HCH transport system substrate-binding protein
MENKAHALAAGFFVLLTSALLVALALWLTHGTGERLAYEVSSREAITGLQPQATVRFRGVNVGKVDTIGFDPTVPGNVLLRLAVDPGTPITRSTYASLGFQGVTGIAFVQLDDTGESREALPTSDGQPGRIPMRAGLVGQLSAQGTRILSQLEETSRRVNELLAPQRQQALMASVGALERAAASVPPAMQQAGASMQSLRDASGSLAAGADAVKSAAADYGRLAQQLQQPGGLIEQLNRSTAELAATGQTLQADTLPRINRGAEETTWAVRQLGRAAAQVNANPQVLIFGQPPGAPGPGEPGFAAPGGRP